MELRECRITDEFDRASAPFARQPCQAAGELAESPVPG